MPRTPTHPMDRAARARSWRQLADVTLAPAGEGAHAHEIEPHHDYATEESAVGGHSSTGLSNNKLAMWLFLGSEGLLFRGLVSTHHLHPRRTPAGDPPPTGVD